MWIDRIDVMIGDGEMINGISPVPALQSTVLDAKMDRLMTMMVLLPLLVTCSCSSHRNAVLTRTALHCTYLRSSQSRHECV